MNLYCIKRTLFTGLCIMFLSAYSLPCLSNTTSDFETATEAVKNMGLGWNLGNTLDAYNQQQHDASLDDYWGQQDVNSETCWGQFKTKPELFAMMKEAGFGAIRVPITWYNHMNKDGNVDAAWMNRVHEVVEYIISQGLYCIINVHHDTGADKTNFKSWIKADETNYTRNEARYKKLWQQIAQEFRDYNQYLLFEAYNEMLDVYSSWNYASSNTSYNAINNYAQSFVDVVRTSGGNNVQRNIIVSTYGASSGSGTGNTKYQEPLKQMKIPDGESNHIIFEVHNYPSIANKTINGIKTEIDTWITILNAHLVSKGAPVIIGEWGTSNVDAGEGKTDYDVRKDLMFAFVDYMIKAMKQKNIATFYWMGLTDGIARTYPAFSQPDLALKMLKAYHGEDYNPTLPDAEDYGGNKITSATVNYTSQWGELAIHKGTIDKTTYQSIKVELEEKPASGSLSFKVYPSGKTTAITVKNPELTFSGYTSIEKITLQWNLTDKGSLKIKSINLIKHDQSSEPCDFEVDWGCSLSDINYVTGIEGIHTTIVRPDDGIIHNLHGQRITTPRKGIYIKNGKKLFIK